MHGSVWKETFLEIVIKEKNIHVINQTLELDCLIEISCRQTKAEEIYHAFDQIFEVTIKEKED